MNMFHDFFQNNIVNRAMNATFIALIPKKFAPQRVNDFRPISLTTSIYKLLAKVLAECLKRVLPYTISQHQSAFVNERQITDPILIVNEVVDY